MNPFKPRSRWWPARAAAPGQRWVVLDLESSGLDASKDRLLSIAAVAVHLQGQVLQLHPADSFEVLLKQPPSTGAPDRANILVHGLGVELQQTGVPPRQALLAFRSYVQGAPLVGYHLAFDQALLARAEQQQGLPVLHRHGLDLAELAPALRPEVKGLALDDWLAVFGIRCLARHQAAADAWATAELLLALWPLACRATRRATGFKPLQALAAQRRWLGG
jgi:DNA polymerase-3 subunit epsilon